jgi:hypothetical protein
MDKVVSGAMEYIVVICSFGYLEASDPGSARCRIHLRTHGCILNARQRKLSYPPKHQHTCPSELQEFETQGLVVRHVPDA